MIWLVPPLLELRRKYPDVRIAVISGTKGVKVLEAFSICDDLFNMKDLLSPFKILRWTHFFKYFRANLFLNIYGPERGLLFQFLLFPKRVETSHYHYATVFDGFTKKRVVFPSKFWVQQVIEFFSDQTFILNHQVNHVSKNIFRFFEMSLNLDYDSKYCYPEELSSSPQGLPLIILSPFSTWEGRNWRIERWLELIQWIREGLKDYQIILFGSPDEKRLYQEMLVIDSSVRFIAANEFKEVLALTQQAKLVVANDSMMTHMSSFLGKPCISLFGPNIPDQFGAISMGSSNLYYPLECSPCRQGSGNKACLKGYQTCLGLDKIEVKEVEELIVKKLDLFSKSI